MDSGFVLARPPGDGAEVLELEDASDDDDV